MSKVGKNKKVLVGVSGGIDSAVSIKLLLDKGYYVEGIFMKNWSDTSGLISNNCPWLVDRREALKVCAFYNIPLHSVDFEQAYSQNVMSKFFESYRQGYTPNPDVLCNKEIKFKLMYNWAMDHGFDYLATGHYARVVSDNGEYQLLRAVDDFKDQTYFIYNIKQEQLPHLLFPVGDYKKSEIKAIANDSHLPNANRKESMGLCFVGKIRLKDFLLNQLVENVGDIVDSNGNVIGQHTGLWQYTLGQRHGINLSGGPYYVLQKNLLTNQLTVGNNPTDTKLAFHQVVITDVNIIANLKFPIKAMTRYRHQGELYPAIISKHSDGQYLVSWDKPVYAVSSAQSIVVYQRDRVVMGGVVL